MDPGYQHHPQRKVERDKQICDQEELCSFVQDRLLGPAPMVDTSIPTRPHSTQLQPPLRTISCLDSKNCPLEVDQTGQVQVLGGTRKALYLTRADCRLLREGTSDLPKVNSIPFKSHILQVTGPAVSIHSLERMRCSAG